MSARDITETCNRDFFRLEEKRNQKRAGKANLYEANCAQIMMKQKKTVLKLL